ncbi:MAG: carboxypeptidase regulatory-like domain-containing protein [Spirochaetia bacterium]|nr:carboxypeptidase regulatory-like domain-containing protein [Spirochaetia bacterium]
MKEERKEISVNFEVTVKEDQGKYIGQCREMPGLVVSGVSRAEVIKNIKAAIPLYLRYVPKEGFIPVFDNEISQIIFDFEEFNGQLYACTNKDAVVRTTSGDRGAWEIVNITNVFSPYFNPPVGSTKTFDSEALGDYTPQVYCLKTFNDLGTPKLFCGTNANGGIYETLDGKNWSLSFNSGEARIHCLEGFKGRLFAGTSTEGKIYSYNGTHWVVALNTSELAVTCFGLFRDYLYAGTYPNGLVFRTADGVNWQKVFDTNQSFVNSFYVFKNRLYASTSKATGGLIFMTEDGTNWIENFFSEKDVNFYKFETFGNSLYVGTGDSGRVYKSLDGRKWELAFQTDEEDVRVLHLFNGYLYFGSSPKGRIFRTTVSNTPPPGVFDVQVAEVTSHSAVITWSTDREAQTIVEYGFDREYGNNIINETMTVKHGITLNNLKSLTEYHFRILTYSDIGSFSGILEDHSFTTPAAITPVITSKTHPDQEKWYNRPDVIVEWGVHPDVKQYLYMVDGAPETVPEIGKCTATTKDGVTVKNLEDGVHFFHVLIEDKAGNISPEVSHFAVRIDTAAAPPEAVCTTHPDADKWYANNAPVFQWQTPQDLSGVYGYFYLMDEMPNTLPTEKTGTFTESPMVRLKPLEDGIKYFHVVTRDRAGNTGTKACHLRVNIDTQAMPPVISSNTHPDEKSWYNLKKAQLHLAKPHDLSGIDGFYYMVDSRPDTEPHENECVYKTTTDIELPEKTDGTWYIHARSRDMAGNVSTDTSHFKINIDTQALPPNISSVTHPDSYKWYNAKKAQFKTGKPEDLSGIDGFYYVIDNAEKTVPDIESAWTDKDTIFSGDLRDGEWYIHVVSRDRAGNTGVMASHFRFNIDTLAKPPKVYSRTHPDQEEWYSNAIPELHWDTPEDMSGIEGYYCLFDEKHNTVPTKDTGEWLNSNQMTLPQLKDGIWYFHIVSKDNAGNIGWEAAHYRIKIDTFVEQPKVSSITHPSEETWYSNPQVKLTWSVPQDLSKIKKFYTLFSREKHLKLNPALAVSTDKREMEFNVDKEGTYFFHIVAEDNAGNTGEEPCIFTVNVDLKATPPDVSSSTHPNPEKYYSTVHPVFVVDRVDDLSGADGFYYMIDHNPDTMPDKKTAKFSKDTTVRILDKLDDGEWYFHIILKDRAGNTGTEAAHYKFRIETTPPEVKIGNLKPFQNSEHFEVEWSGEDKESGVYCFDVEYREGDKGKWKAWLKETKSRTAIFKGEDGITYYFRARARDNAGNWSEYFEHESIRTTVDISSPSQVTQIVAKPVKEGRISIEWSKSVDSISGLDYYRIYRSSVSGQLGMQINDDGTVTDTKFVDESKDLEDGIIYYYTVRAVDKVGNERESGNKQVLAICDRFAMPPVVRSMTHPMQQEWYNNRNIKLTWDTPQDATRIAGYYYIFDQIATTIPDARTGTWFTDNEIEFNNSSEGTWYFHVISKDEAGNMSDEATHYQVNVDTSRPKPPVISSITHADFNRWYNNNAPSFSWTTPSDPAGIEGYYYIFNQIRNTVPDITTASWTKGTMASFVDVPDGVWYLHAIAKDTAGNMSEDCSHLQVNVAMSPPPPLVFSPSHQDQEKWYRDTNVKLQWKPMQYVNDIIGYYYVVDAVERTIPGPKNSKTMDTNIELPGLGDGIWYFHVVAVDKEGVIGKTASHFRIKIKTRVTLRGTVTQSNGIMPLSGATVEVMREDGTTLGISISDKDGNYTVDNLAVGKVKVKVLTRNLPPQMLYDIELKSDEPERVLNVSSEIFAMYEPATEKIFFNYYIPEDGTVTIKVYNEAGKTMANIEEIKKGKIYNSSAWEVNGVEDGVYLYQITAKGGTSGKITRYGIRKIKKGK